jgi:predicted dinucleotide-binding enzyme
MGAGAVGRCIAFCLGEAGIDATLGSARGVAASAALAAGASLGDVLGMGSRSNASTFFRLYHDLW